MNKEANRTNKSITLDSDLISFLKTQDNHKFSRYDAFVWLIERICEAKDGKRDDIPSSPRQEYLVKYTGLAKTWRWSRPTVQKFIEGLESLSVIVKEKYVNSFALSLPEDDALAKFKCCTSHHPPINNHGACTGNSRLPIGELAPSNRGKRKSNRGKECVKNA